MYEGEMNHKSASSSVARHFWKVKGVVGGEKEKSERTRLSATALASFARVTSSFASLKRILWCSIIVTLYSGFTTTRKK